MEQRLIDANALIKAMCSSCALFLDKTCEGNRISCYPSSIVREQPTVDAVPVTVCASCKYDGKCMFQSFVIENSQDDVSYDRNTFYCADGERKNNETKLKGE